MVDAGFVDLVRPAMYGSYHHITVHGARRRREPPEPFVVAGPLCESGDVFTRDARRAARAAPPAAARASATCWSCTTPAPTARQMSSNYISIGRAPQVWLEDGRAHLMSRRETLEDIVRTECFEPL